MAASSRKLIVLAARPGNKKESEAMTSWSTNLWRRPGRQKLHSFHNYKTDPNEFAEYECMSTKRCCHLTPNPILRPLFVHIVAQEAGSLETGQATLMNI